LVVDAQQRCRNLTTCACSMQTTTTGGHDATCAPPPPPRPGKLVGGGGGGGGGGGSCRLTRLDAAHAGGAGGCRDDGQVPGGSWLGGGGHAGGVGGHGLRGQGGSRHRSLAGCSHQLWGCHHHTGSVRMSEPAWVECTCICHRQKRSIAAVCSQGGGAQHRPACACLQQQELMRTPGMCPHLLEQHVAQEHHTRVRP